VKDAGALSKQVLFKTPQPLLTSLLQNTSSSQNWTLQISPLQQIEENVLILILSCLEHNLFEKKFDHSLFQKKLDQKPAFLSTTFLKKSLTKNSKISPLERSEKGSALQSRNSAGSTLPSLF
jgi:hypothetical protein